MRRRVTLLAARLVTKVFMQKPNQKGAALIIFALILVLAATAFMVSQLDSSGINIERDKKTAGKFAQAKTALIGSVISTANIASPSYLPNPDLKLGATIEGRQALSSGAVDISLIGKFPWRALGVSPLKDGWNECLWYVVSGRFKNFPSTSVFNWDTQGQITVIDANGTILASNLAALIVSAGALLSGQDRQLAAIDTPQCGGNYDVRNYLDSYNLVNAVAGEVNYFAGSTNNRQAPNANNKEFVLTKNDFYNDQFAFVTVDEIFRPLIRRSDFSVQVNALLDDVEFKSHAQAIVVAGSKGTSNVNCATILTNVNNKEFCDNWMEMLLLAELPTTSPIIVDGAATTPCSRILIFGGQKTGVQTRLSAANKNDPANYLEGINLTEFNTPIANGINFNGVSTFDVNISTSADILRCL